MYLTHHNRKHFSFSIKEIFGKPLTCRANRNDLGRVQEANWMPRPEDRGQLLKGCEGVPVHVEGGDHPRLCPWEPEEQWELLSNSGHNSYSGNA